MILAKTNPNVPLMEHLMTTAEVCRKLSLNVSSDIKTSLVASFIGAIHDIGKTSPSFQAYINGGDNDYILHNMLGSDLITNCISSIKVSGPGIDVNDEDVDKKMVAECIRFHHPIKDDEKQFTEEDVDAFVDFMGDFLQEINKRYEGYAFDIKFDNKFISNFKEYGLDIKKVDYHFLNDCDTYFN